MDQEPDIYSKSGLNSILNPTSLPDNPFESGKAVSDEQSHGESNEFARHPALTNNFADLTVLDMPQQMPGGAPPNQETIPSSQQSMRAFQSVQTPQSPSPTMDPQSAGQPPMGDSQLMDQLLGIMINGAGMRMQFCQKVAALMVENADIMQNIMGQVSQVVSNK
ncbi:MAG: hypothetical protein ACXAE3_07325 [Candidatus Kariarchaeaceae archaeon]|jgi:hypothetical protein